MSDERSERGMERDARRGNDQIQLRALVRELRMGSMTWAPEAEVVARARELMARGVRAGVR